MTFTGDERGQPVVIGALLIFTILILVFAGYQAFAVPNQNAEVEFNHFQDVQSDFAEFESNLVNAVESGDTRSASIDLGPQYPSRMLALNPPPAAGSLRTTEPGDVVINGTNDTLCSEGGTPTSRSLVYRPGYAEFDNAESIVYENRFTTRQFREGSVFGEQRLVESRSGNDRINLLLLTGEVSENGIGGFNVEIAATSRYSKTVENPTITLPSRFSANDWNNDILADRSDVTVTNNGTNRVDLDFTGGDYTVSCAVAGLNSEPTFSPPETAENTPDNPSSPPQIDSATLERNNESLSDFLTARTYSQFNFSYQVNSPDGTLEKVGLQLQDSTGEVYTATTQTVTNSGSYEGQWITPLFNNENLDSLDSFSVRIEVFTTDGVSEVQTVTIGSGGNSPPSVTVNSVIYNDRNKQVEVMFTPDDSDGNLDTADITVENEDGDPVRSRSVDISNEEGTQLTEQFSSLPNNKKPYTVQVTVEDTDGALASDSGTS